MNLYNAVHYPTHAKPQTHPDHLGVLATLFGMQPAPATRCRVLEIGCGAGGNIIAMAAGLPASEFIGIDLASDPIEQGRQSIAALRLRNIQLHAMDLMDVTAEFGTFDYIVVFGVFSWIPPEVRQKLLQICAGHLAPQGVAFINYNAYPGFHLRSIVRDMLLYRVQGIADPEEAVGQAYALVDSLINAQAREDEYGACLHHELEDIRKRPPSGLFHDDLSPHNHAFYFHEFAGIVAEHGLQYLAEAEYYTMHEGLYGERVTEALRPFAGDVIGKEQYLDFIRGRKFRQTLVCHTAVTLEREIGPERVRGLRFSSPARPDAEGRFRRAMGVPIKPVHPMARAALMALSDTWPRRLTFAELLAACGDAGDAEMLAQILLGCFATGLIEAHLHAPKIALEPGARPVASPLARLQFADDIVAVNLHHTLVQIDDEDERRLVQLLDGKRDRGELARELGMTEEALAEKLRSIARLALLVDPHTEPRP